MSALSAPPRDDAGFRLRGMQMNRTETFTDAAFAFALTLLVVSLDPPASYIELRHALQDVPAFLLSATMLMVFWRAHHTWSRRFGLEDTTSIILSCILVFTVLIYVYPLRFMFGLMMSWYGGLFGVTLGNGVTLDRMADVNQLFVIYGIGFSVMATTIVLLNLHALRLGKALGLDAVERHETAAMAGAWAIMTGFGIASTVAAVVLPENLPGIPGWVYAPLAIVMPMYGRAMTRRRPSGQEEPVVMPEPAAVRLATTD